MHAIRVIVVTDTQANPQTGPITIHCAAAIARSEKVKILSTYNVSLIITYT